MSGFFGIFGVGAEVLVPGNRSRNADFRGSAGRRCVGAGAGE